MSAAILLFLARALLLLLLYLFLYLVVQTLRQDLRSAASETRPEGRAKPLFAGPLGPGTSSLRLELIDAGQTPLLPGQRYSLGDPLLIGRSARSNITLEDDWVSAEHLRLRRLQGAWLAEDLGSTNGTRLNGRPLKGAARVRAGDVLDLGRVKFKLVEQG
ncbi:MAG TPA: FHA domain-containing protein [Chloroflexota bacterium]|nr:FHA domain-containing protein [Chloroflexota bacterium]